MPSSRARHPNLEISMQPQLAQVEDEFESASNRLHRLAESCSVEEWRRRPEEGSWSAAECVAHLNITSIACLPSIDEGLAEARTLGRATGGRMRRDPMGWLLWKGSHPNPRMKIKTGAGFVPAGGSPRDELIAEFDRLQEEQLAALRSADGLPIDRVKVRSVFVDRIRYSLFSLFTILSIHQHRHLAQAERAVASARGLGAAV